MEILTFTYDTSCYITSDFNSSLLNNGNNINEFVDLLFSHSFLTTLTKPTRVSENSATLIDHIWTNDDVSISIFKSTLSNYKGEDHMTGQDAKIMILIFT